jgi:hypothetical protein
MAGKKSRFSIGAVLAASKAICQATRTSKVLFTPKPISYSTPGLKMLILICRISQFIPYWAKEEIPENKNTI